MAACLAAAAPVKSLLTITTNKISYYYEETSGLIHRASGGFGT